jgi:hypothetical protein
VTKKARGESTAGYTIIPDAVRLNRSLSSTALRVYLVLSAEARDKKNADIGKLGLRLIARLGCCSVPSTSAAIKELCRLGYIEKRGGERERTSYTLTSKWHIPKDQRVHEETVWQGDGLKVVRNAKRAKYQPRRHEWKEESA